MIILKYLLSKRKFYKLFGENTNTFSKFLHRTGCTYIYREEEQLITKYGRNNFNIRDLVFYYN